MAKPVTSKVQSDDRNFFKALKRAAGRKMTSQDRHQQKVSFILGTMGDDSTITREEVERILEKQEG